MADAPTNPFYNFDPSTFNSFPALPRSKDSMSQGIRQYGVAIPDYVATPSHKDPPANIQDNYAGKPAYFRFAISSVDTTGLVTEGSQLDKLKKYYGAASDKGLFKNLTRSRATRQKLYVGFSLQKVSEEFAEKFQLIETYGDSFTSFFFGQKPMVINISGILIDDQLSDWKAQFIYIYNTYLRGFHTSKHKILTEFGYGNTVIKGVMLELNTETGDVTNEVVTPFSTKMLVYKYNKFSSAYSHFYNPDIGKDEDYSTGNVKELANARFYNAAREATPLLSDPVFETAIAASAVDQYKAETMIAALNQKKADAAKQLAMKNCSGSACKTLASGQGTAPCTVV